MLTLRNTKGSALSFTEMDNNLTYLESIAGGTGDFFIAINFKEVEEFEYISPNNFKINSIDNLSGLTLDIKVNAVTYVLGATINENDILTINSSAIGFIKLICEEI